MHRCALVLSAALTATTLHAAPVLLPLDTAAARGPNLLTNPGFEEVQDGLPLGWSSHNDNDWTLDSVGAHAGQRCVRFSKPSTEKQYWIGQDVNLNQDRPRPLVVSAWSKADGAQGNRGPEYSVWVDLAYADGTSLWGQRATFQMGTHDWQYGEYSFVVTKPVKLATVHLLFRRGVSGTVWFDDVSLQELDAGAGLLFDRASATVAEGAAAHGTPGARLATADGLELMFDDRGRPAGLSVHDTPLLGDGPGGMWVRDVAADGAWLRPTFTVTSFRNGVELEGTEQEAGLELASSWTANDSGIDVEARVRDLTGRDRAVTVYFVLPLARLPWVWHEDLLTSTQTSDDSEYLNASGWPIHGIASAYPFCFVTSQPAGLSLSVPMDCPRVFRLTYNATASCLYIAVNLGLVPDTANFPSSADFRFSIYHADPAWGFRAATDKYHHRHPEFFARRLDKGGIWNAFGDISKVENWQDFGFAYDENSATPLAFDNEHGITSFRYIEPMTYWLPMAQSYPRTYEGAIQALRDNLAGGTEDQKRWARATLSCGAYTREQELDLSLENQAWCDGAVFTLNPDPLLPETEQFPLNKGRMGYTPQWADEHLLQEHGPRLDGIYLDSLPNWGDVRNWRREHWKTVEVPLTFDPDHKEPVLLQIFSTWQFANWVAKDVHGRGGYMHGNGGTLWPFFPALLDVTGQETGGILRHPTMAMARTLLRDKPYSPLLNTRFEGLPDTFMPDYFHQSALWCIFPSFFNGDTFEDGKWKIARFFDIPELCERVRPLYRQFIPVLRRMFAAGWEPVTHAKASPEGVMLERYGPGEQDELLLAVCNSAQDPVDARVLVDTEALGLDATVSATRLLDPGTVPTQATGEGLLAVCPLEPGRCEVIHLSR